MTTEIIKYKGFDIEKNLYGHNEYIVQYEGNDMWFEELDEAKTFVEENLTPGLKFKDIRVGSILMNKYGCRHKVLRFENGFVVTTDGIGEKKYNAEQIKEDKLHIY